MVEVNIFTLDRDEPLLGLATTRELLRELEARMRTTQNSLAGDDLGKMCRDALKYMDNFVLDYRTVDPCP